MQEPKICTVENPYTPDKKGEYTRWVHPDADFIHDGEYRDTYHCPICDLTFFVEVSD